MSEPTPRRLVLVQATRTDRDPALRRYKLVRAMTVVEGDRFAHLRRMHD